MAAYRSGLGRAIRALKYGLAREIAAPLGALLAEWLATANTADALLMPVPLHEDRRRERGFNQSELLCEVISRQTGLALDTDSLVRIRKTIAQVNLDAGERHANVHGAFAAAARLDGRAVLLIDDVCTTGATLGECSLALSGAGAGPIWALTLAREA